MKTRIFKISNTMVASVLFVALTAVKLLLPGQTEAFRHDVKAVVSHDYDYESALEELGGNISENRWVQALGRPLSNKAEVTDRSIPVQTYQPVTIFDLREEMTDILPKNTVHADVAVSETVQKEDTPEVVAAFLQTQEKYADYEIPANVTYDMPALPFAYKSPLPNNAASGFGYRLHPIENEVKFHYGTDFAAWSGTDICSFADGTVSMVGFDEGYGNYVVIDHGDGWQTQYAHCGKVYVACGQSVSMGEKIALVGATGRVTGPHMHFELRCDGVYYNPEFYLT